MSDAARTLLITCLAAALSALAGCGSGASTTSVARAAVAPAPAAEGYDIPGLSMAERLDRIARTSDPDQNRYLSIERAELDRKRLEQATTAAGKLFILPAYVRDLVQAGKPEEALKALDELDELQKAHDRSAWEAGRNGALMLRALCYLRLGEQENCLERHTCESCLLPIRKGGQHARPRGSRSAMQVLLKLLKRSPEDLAARWLLNVAAMTVGDYPDKVPARWRIPEQALKSSYDIKPFKEVAESVGLGAIGHAGGSIVEDFDGDGFLDVVTSSVNLRDQMSYFRNNGDGTFTERTGEAGLTGQISGLNLSQADYNNDGHPDILVLRGGWFGEQGRHPISLLRNDGKGVFTDVTEQARLLRYAPLQTAAWLDYNGDGWLDLFLGNETNGGTENPCQLFRNNRNGTFTECAAANGAAVVGFVKGVGAADYNNDGRPDLYVSVLGGKNRLLRNDGPSRERGADWKFTDVAVQAGVEEPTGSFPCFFFDYDNDGWEDIFVCSYFVQSTNVGAVAADYLGLPHKAGRPRLYHNNRNGTFTDVGAAAGLDTALFGMGINYGDLDNDGWLDFYVGTGTPELSFVVPNRMFRNAEGRFFQDVTYSGGFGNVQKGHGISFADIDNDGDQDVHEDMGGAYPGDTAFNTLFENPGHGNRWLKLKLEGTHTNRSAVGARVRVFLQTPGGPRVLHRTVGTGGSFGCNPIRMEIGCGRASAVDRVEVFWPRSGRTQTVSGLELDRCYRIREGGPGALLEPHRPFRLRQ